MGFSDTFAKRAIQESDSLVIETVLDWMAEHMHDN
jgi:uncharacterized UBP type Zn finger protein